MLTKILYFFLEHRLFTWLLFGCFILIGLIVIPFSVDTGLPSYPVSVDAIPDLGENQQIISVEWAGQSPQVVEDHITFPLTSRLLAVPGVHTVRSTSMYGLSMMYVIFDESVEYYWSRSRILETLNALPKNILPEEVSPKLGPDATGLGQIFWYYLENVDESGMPSRGFTLREQRAYHDEYIKPILSSIEGVAEIASIGGYEEEVQISIFPEALNQWSLTLPQVAQQLSGALTDVGLSTIEINQAEYFIRAPSPVENWDTLRELVVMERNGTILTLGELGHISLVPQNRRGILDKSGEEKVGGVVISRYGENPMKVIAAVKEKIQSITPTLPTKMMADGKKIRLEIRPFYDRSGLIKETLATLEEALTLEIIISIIVILVLLHSLGASLIISAMLPISIILVFVAMKVTGIEANIVALSGIAIAIGTMVDLSIILTERIMVQSTMRSTSILESIKDSLKEVSGAIIAAVSTTILSFIPVFLLQGAEGKLFRPLAFTKTYALISAVIVTLILLPSVAWWILNQRSRPKTMLFLRSFGFGIISMGAYIFGYMGLMGLFLSLTIWALCEPLAPSILRKWKFLTRPVLILGIIWILTLLWMPLTWSASFFSNLSFIILILGMILGGFLLFIRVYPSLLRNALRYKAMFMMLPFSLLVFAWVSWQGIDRATFGVDKHAQSPIVEHLEKIFPGLGSEFMPSLDEGAFLYMPTMMPHSGSEMIKKYLSATDRVIESIPEVKSAVGKAGRVESALDPAPLAMFETLIEYYPEYAQDEEGRILRFATQDSDYIRLDGAPFNKKEWLEEGGNSALLRQEKGGVPLRLWRDHIRTPEDIWKEIEKKTKFPGLTSAPKLQPIETRLVMLQSGMRAPMGIKIQAGDLASIEKTGKELEKILKSVSEINAASVFAERIVGKPYASLTFDPNALAQVGLTTGSALKQVEAAIKGMSIGTITDGRTRTPVILRLPKEMRDNAERFSRLLIQTPSSGLVPFSSLGTVIFERGPQMIKSEDTFPTGYVFFNKKEGVSESEAVEAAQRVVNEAISTSRLKLPSGVAIDFAGTFQQRERAEKRLKVIIPLVFIAILMVLYLQFRSLFPVMMIFSGVVIACSGGFIFLWLFNQPWFLEISWFGTSLRSVFNIGPMNLSIAVWVGFIALFGIATDDGVVMATYLKQTFDSPSIQSIREIEDKVVEAGIQRVRPCLMTTATTLIALLPILTSNGKGADIMIPMAIPVLGGMTVALITLFIVPVLWAVWQTTIRTEGDKNHE